MACELTLGINITCSSQISILDKWTDLGFEILDESSNKKYQTKIYYKNDLIYKDERDFFYSNEHQIKLDTLINQYYTQRIRNEKLNDLGI